jgi:hypothetical protein
LQRTIGNQAVLRLMRNQAKGSEADVAASHPGLAHNFASIPVLQTPVRGIQRKLTVNEPGDAYEQEADRVADQVMRMPAPQTAAAHAASPVSAGSAAGLQRACACGGTCDDCKKKHPDDNHVRVQMKAAGPVNAGGIEAPPIVHEVLRSPGQPLDAATRAFMEPRFGHDFSGVRVHTDARAAESAKVVQAKAYTAGQNVVFGAGAFAPGSEEGQRLLGHELAHVVQSHHSVPTHRSPPKGPIVPTKVNAPVSSAAALASSSPMAKTSSQTVRLKPDDAYTKPKFIKERASDTDLIENAYGRGTLNETEWTNLINTAERDLATGNSKDATATYLALYRDAAKLAQASRVILWSTINVVTGSEYNCGDAKPGLNFTLADSGAWGANGTTDYVDDKGKFGVKPGERGKPQPLVAIVLSRSAFVRQKERTLGILRHEMVHAEHLQQDADALLFPDPKARSGPVPTTLSKTELFAYVEGFMTMFHLTHPAPTDPNHPAFVELLGALDTGKSVLPWSGSARADRSEALGRLQEYYCHALDPSHKEAFKNWVDYKSAQVRKDRFTVGKYSKEDFRPGSSFDDDLIYAPLGNPKEAEPRLEPRPDDFFHGLQGIIANKCKGLLPLTRMALDEPRGKASTQGR